MDSSDIYVGEIFHLEQFRKQGNGNHTAIVNVTRKNDFKDAEPIVVGYGIAWVDEPFKNTSGAMEEATVNSIYPELVAVQATLNACHSAENINIITSNVLLCNYLSGIHTEGKHIQGSEELAFKVRSQIATRSGVTQMFLKKGDKSTEQRKAAKIAKAAYMMELSRRAQQIRQSTLQQEQDQQQPQSLSQRKKDKQSLRKRNDIEPSGFNPDNSSLEYGEQWKNISDAVSNNSVIMSPPTLQNVRHTRERITPMPAAMDDPVHGVITRSNVIMEKTDNDLIALDCGKRYSEPPAPVPAPVPVPAVVPPNLPSWNAEQNSFLRVLKRVDYNEKNLLMKKELKKREKAKKRKIVELNEDVVMEGTKAKRPLMTKFLPAPMGSFPMTKIRAVPDIQWKTNKTIDDSSSSQQQQNTENDSVLKRKSSWFTKFMERFKE
ncbi:hypothetical protein BDA99DRAFT_496408 [Phascolomyces articulosus]|uniref:Uncharacterized protein n=1 Tax=Phascolomyces articulosus TaxID=60185 RepID=A0AAD5PJ41_9FUNG|nr:hypothetical protein BDA99DRAFT_496408 [Phascolomyces articulosus]